MRQAAKPPASILILLWALRSKFEFFEMPQGKLIFKKDTEDTSINPTFWETAHVRIRVGVGRLRRP
ncbi:MAG: hypothetical protein ACO4AI_12015, partial [Prochlorothrix sp.]